MVLLLEVILCAWPSSFVHLNWLVHTSKKEDEITTSRGVKAWVIFRWLIVASFTMDSWVRLRARVGAGTGTKDCQLLNLCFIFTGSSSFWCFNKVTNKYYTGIVYNII